MRPYLAVIKDSFREAFASRVLWILLVLITLLLLALAPLGVVDKAASSLRNEDLISGTELAKELVEQGNSASPSPAKHVWGFLSDDLRRRLTQMETESTEEPSESLRVMLDLVSQLNGLFEQPDFYDETAWADQRLGDEAQALLDRGVPELSDGELRRFNRLAFDAAFSEHVAPAPQSAMQVVYFGFEIGDTLPLDREQLETIVKTAMLAIMSFLVGALGVFVAILVTASIIPHMFESGAINLLLSRPLSRSLLFLTKFVGGCVFILLNSTYLIVGLWLIVGFRFDIWNSRLLLCIPVFLFLFAIYYCVSAFAGVVWKNAVVCVVIAILFWAACFTVGTTKGVIESIFLDPERIALILPAGDTLLVRNEGGETLEWDDGEWDPVFVKDQRDAGPFGMMPGMIGPVFDAPRDQIVGIESSMPQFAGFGGAGTLVVGRREDNWRRVSGVAAPAGTSSMFIDGEGRILVAGTAGISRFEGDPAVEHVPVKLFGFDIAPRGKAGRFVDVGPSETKTWLPPFAAAQHPKDDRLALFSRGVVTVLSPDPEGRYVIDTQTDLDSDEAAVIGFAGSSVLVALGSGEIRVFDADTLEQVASDEPFGSEKPRSIAASPDGRWFAALYHNRKLSLYDADQAAPLEPEIDGQGAVSAARFSADNKLLIADRLPRVIEYDVETWSVERRLEPESGVLELVYSYVVLPIYTVFPKPGELDNLVSYLLTDQETVAIGGREQSLQSERVVLNIWEPVWSNLAFLAVVLGLTCLYIERRDF